MQLVVQRRHRRCPLSLTLEPLEIRTLMAADFGVVASAAAQGTQQVETANFPRFESEELLRDELIAAAVERYRDQFGQPTYRHWNPELVYFALGNSDERGVVTTLADIGGREHSTTNVQTAGVDEADIVKTDGNYIYFVDGSDLVIIDTHAAADLQVVSRIDLHGAAASIYLLNDRLTVITQRYSWNYYDRWSVNGEGPQYVDSSSLRGSTVSVAVYDISDRTKPDLITETDFEGTLVQSRMIRSQIYLVTQSQLNLPALQTLPGGDSGTIRVVDAGTFIDFSSVDQIDQGWHGTSNLVYESEAEYRARIGEQILETALPKYATYGPDGQFLRSGRLLNASNIYDRDLVKNNSLVSVLVFDAAGNLTGPQSSTSVPAGYVSQIYASLDNLYVVEQNSVEGQPVSDIYRFAFRSHGVELAAIGEVPGSTINQFSLDEYNGHLRVATQTGSGTTARSAVYVLEITGLQMNIVGRLENLTPGERLYSSRFVGDRGFLVTFGPQGAQTGPNGVRINPPNWVDPLITVDLSDPTNPQLRAQLVIPGFSNYLQVVDDRYLIGFGRDADTLTGRWTDPQVSIFDVADLDNPVLVDRYLIPLGQSVQSDAFADHHAISYFADQHVLAIPMNRSGYETVQDGLVTRQEYRTRSQMWVFKVDPTSADALQSLGTVDLHAPLLRSVRIEDELYSIAGQTVQASRLDEPGTMLGQVYFGPLAFDTRFTIDRTSPTSSLDVLANFQLPDDIKQVLHITAVEAPRFGSVAISSDGKTLSYTIPTEALERDDTLKYTVTDAQGRSEQGTATIRVAWSADAARLLQTVKADVASKLGVPIEAIVTGRPRPGGGVELSAGYLERVWTDATLSFRYGEPTDATAGFEFIVNYHSNVFIYHSDLTDRIVLADEQLFTGWDEFTVPENSAATFLNVTANDYPDVRHYKSPQLVTVGQGDRGGATRLSDDGLQVVYTPPANYIGLERIKYTLANGEEGTIKVRIPWDRLADGAVTLAMADLAGKVGLTADALRSRTTVTSVIQPVVSDELFLRDQFIGFEIHLNYAGVDVEYDVNGNQAVQQVYSPRLIVRDEFHVAKNTVGALLQVQRNDFPGTYYSQISFPIVATSNSAAGGTVEIIQGNSIRYTPPANFTGVDTFAYTVGDQTVPVKVHVEESTDQATFRLVVRNQQGDSAGRVRMGDEVTVELYAVDKRDGERGLVAADLDLLFDAQVASLQSIVYGAGASGENASGGTLHIQYAASGAKVSQTLLATVRLRVVGSGPLVLSTRSDLGGIEFSGALGIAVATTPVDVTSSVRVIAPFPTAPNSRGLDVNSDGDVTMLDALVLVNRLNGHPSRAANSEGIQPDIAARLGFGMRYSRPQYLEPDGNGRLDALDVLRVVNRLNQRAAAHDQVLASL